METTAETAKQHREAGRGRKAFWVAMALATLIAVAWLTPTRAQRPHGGGASFHGHGPTTHSLATLGIELREHAGMLAYAGLTAPQVERLANAFDERSGVFAELESARGAIERRIADAVTAQNLDLGEIARSASSTHLHLAARP
jgi:hypothetical protein